MKAVAVVVLGGGALALAGCSGAPHHASGSQSAVLSAGPVRSSVTAGPPVSSSPQSMPSARSVSAAPLPANLTAVIETWRLPQAVSRQLVFTDRGSLLVVGGLTDRGSTSAITRVDSTTGARAPSGELAKPVHDAAAATLGDTRLVFGGGASTTVATVQALDTAGTAKIVGRLPHPRSDLVCAVIGSTAYIVGGYHGSTILPQILATTDGRVFRAVATLPVPVRYPAIAVAGNDVYVFGGEQNGVPTDAIQQFDPRSGTVKIAGHLDSGLAHASAVVIRGSIYLLGGLTAQGASSAILRFDPATAATASAGTLPYAVSDAGSAVVGDTAYLLGGESPARLATVIGVHP